MNNKRFSGMVALLSVGLLLPAMSHGKKESLDKIIQVTSYNNTDQSWGGKVCVAGTGLQCKSFGLGMGQHVEETLPLPGAGRVGLNGYFTHLIGRGGSPVTCNTSFQVSGSDVMSGSIYVTQSSGTYSCHVAIAQ